MTEHEFNALAAQGYNPERSLAYYRRAVELVRGIPGVTAVNVDLASGRVDIDSDTPIEQTAIAHAVDEAGYQLAS